jgi:hypothetical protein
VTLMKPRYRVRLAVNILNGSTLFGVLVAAAGRARLARGPEGLLVGSGYRLRVPVAPAFCMGNVILARDHEGPVSGRLLAHEARHATQYAWCAGLIMLPLYFIAAGASWVLTGDFAARNVFERRAGLADGGYADRDLRPAFARFGRKAAPGGGLSA